MPAMTHSTRAGTALAVGLTVAIVDLALITAYIHLTLGGTLFTLNAIGYAALAAALVVSAVPHPFVRRFAWLPRIGLAGYTAITIVAYLVIGPYFTLGWVAKGIEVGDHRAARRGPRSPVRLAGRARPGGLQLRSPWRRTDPSRLNGTASRAGCATAGSGSSVARSARLALSAGGEERPGGDDEREQDEHDERERQEGDAQRLTARQRLDGGVHVLGQLRIGPRGGKVRIHAHSSSMIAATFASSESAVNWPKCRATIRPSRPMK